MAFTPVEGRLTSVGPSQVNQKSASTLYRSLIFKDANSGEEISVSKCTVGDHLDRHVRAGTEGVFVFGKTLFGGSCLVGFRNEENQTVDADFASGNMKPTIFLCLGLFGAGFLLTVVIITFFIGIPLMIFAVILWFTTKSFMKGTREALQENGFSLSASPRAI